MSNSLPIFVFSDSTIRSYGDGDSDWNDAKSTSVFSYSCPYCNINCESEEDDASYGVTGWVKDRFASCTRCGWWSYESDCDDLSGIATYHSVAAIMKKFDHDSLEVPITSLTSYIDKNQDLIHSIHPAKLEELVGAIYSEVLGYKVEYCSYGRPDLGIDLIVVNIAEGRTIAIQVKRNKHPIELGMIHQFFGAMVHNDQADGVFVTSGRFRSGAFTTAKSLERKSRLAINLIDGKRLLEFVGIMNSKNNKPIARDFSFWKSHAYFGNS